MVGMWDDLVLLLPLKQSLDRFSLAKLTPVLQLIMLPPIMALLSQETSYYESSGRYKKTQWLIIFSPLKNDQSCITLKLSTHILIVVDLSHHCHKSRI